MNRSLSRSVTVGEYLLNAMSTWGTRFIFGVPGPTTRELLEAIERTRPAGGGLEVVVARHEAGAAFMADGYARVSGRAGLCLATGGPGATSAATGVLVAQADGVPMVLVVGECPEHDSERGAFQDARLLRLDSLEMFRNLSGYCRRVDTPEAAAEVLEKLGATLFGQRPGTAVVGLSSDVTAQPMPPTPLPVPPEQRRSARSVPAPSAWAEQFQALLGAERPLLFVGSGARRALDDPLDSRSSRSRLSRLIQVAERHALPVVTSPRAKGVFPETHPMSLGGYGIAENAWSRRYVHAGLDALTVLGSALGQWTTAGWDRRLSPAGALVHVDVDPKVVGRNYKNSLGVTADTADYLDTFLTFAETAVPHANVSLRRRLMVDAIRRGPRWLDDDPRSSLATPLKPQRVMSELQAVLNHDVSCKRGVNLFCDVGNVLGWAWQHLVLGLPHRFYCNTSMGALGWASGAVIGGKLAAADTPALALLSERALLMNGVEISTAVEQRIGAVWMVLVEKTMTEAFEQTASDREAPSGWQSPVSPRNVDLAEFARSLGASQHSVREPGQLVRHLAAAFGRARNSGCPEVLIVEVDGREKPVFPHLLTRDWQRGSG